MRRSAYTAGEVHGVKRPPSSLHSKLERRSLERNRNAAVVRITTAPRFAPVKRVCGGVTSTTKRERARAADRPARHARPHGETWRPTRRRRNVTLERPEKRDQAPPSRRNE